jgi:endonuclease YncB( thermonuclease family)
MLCDLFYNGALPCSLLYDIKHHMPQARKIPFAYKLLVIVIALIGLLLLYQFVPRYATVETVINGDTLLLENGTVVKLIGVTTPEANDPEERVRQFGLAASDFTQNMVEGKEIKIKYHYQQDNTDGRALASVYLVDGTCLNSELIKQGYGHADRECTAGDVKEFLEYERQAQENRRGLWADMPEE